MVFFSEEHLEHRPRNEIWGGRPRPHPEVPSRVEEIIGGLGEDFPVSKPEPLEMDLLYEVHPRRYVEHLERTSSGLKGSSEAFPFVFSRGVDPPANYLARRGFYSLDTVTPITAGTYGAALGAVSCAVSGARLVAAGEGPAYCLCRPPGHHASREISGGYCYLNNAAVAAKYLGPGRRAILDIDAHHGNGTQDIFYEDPGVLTCSVHGDPRTRYPYIGGFASEKGEGDGRGYNLNRPLPGETGGSEWIGAIEGLLEHIEAFRPAYLVVCLGLDGLSRDRNGPLRLKEGDYALAGKLISRMCIPTCIVQEGGYHLPSIGECARLFLQNWS